MGNVTEGLKLRPYQDEAIAAVAAEFNKGIRRTAVVLPTGTGKTVVMSRLAEFFVAATGERVVIAVHRDELAEQTVRKLAEVSGGGLKVGVVKAARDETDADVVVAGVQTLARPGRLERLARGGRPVGLVIIDECHHATARTYVEMLKGLGCWDGGSARAVGFTATLGRSDGQALGAVFESVAFQRGILEFVRAGYLLDVFGKHVTVEGLDLRKVKTVAGDYQDDALGEALIDSLAPAAVARAYKEHASDRQGIGFAPSVDSSEAFREAFCAEGIVAEAIYGGTPLDERRETYRRAFAGDTQVLWNCMVLTEGFDWPQASCAVVARPTSSTTLFTQMVGRVLRPFRGQEAAMVLDVVGVGSKHRLATIADLSGREPREGETMVEADERETLDALELEFGDGEDRSGVPDVYGGRDGKLKTTDFDLFGQSRSVWLQTYKGIYFIDAEKVYIFLAPSFKVPGAFTVTEIPKFGTGGRWTHEDCDLSVAFAWAEQDAAAHSMLTTSRVASWRRNPAPSDGQLAEATRRGLVVPEGSTRGEVSDLISRDAGSRRIDGLQMFR